MKKVLFSLAAAFTAVLLASFTLSAQEDDNRYSDGSVQRGPYLTNEIGENWFIGVGGGINTVMYDPLRFGGIGIAVEANVGKWFTPALGLRAGYHGFNNSVKNTKRWIFNDSFGYHVAHVDLLWNVATSIDGYKESRLWNPILYPQVAGIFTMDQDGSKKGLELGIGGGFLNLFQVSDRFGITLDLNILASREKAWSNKGNIAFFPSATVGVAVNLGESGFRRYVNSLPSVDPVDPALIAALHKKLDDAEDKIAADQREINALKAKLSQFDLAEGQIYEFKEGKFIASEPEAAAQPEIFYFDVAKTTLSERELARLEFYAQNSFSKTKQYVVTGGADSGTGSAEVNARLSKQRAEYVKDMLVKNYGFSAENFETKAEVLASDSPIKGRIVTVIAK